MKIHSDWSTSAFDLPPVAADIGPFAGRPFLNLLWRHDPAGELRLAETTGALLPLVLGPAGLTFVGPADLVDYRSPLGADGAAAASEIMEAVPAGTPFVFDSLPREAAVPLAEGAALAGRTATIDRHAVTAVLNLPTTMEDYLGSLDRKERHELRRKRRRFEAQLGSPALATRQAPGGGFARFMAMHRESAGEKGGFLTAQMEEFFAELLTAGGWRLDLLNDDRGRAVAAAIGWADERGYYLYNAAYDAGLAAASPGIVLLAALIEDSIRARRRIFDFLKGDEGYKFRLGARPRPLFVIRGMT